MLSLSLSSRICEEASLDVRSSDDGARGTERAARSATNNRTTSNARALMTSCHRDTRYTHKRSAYVTELCTRFQVANYVRRIQSTPVDRRNGGMRRDIDHARVTKTQNVRKIKPDTSEREKRRVGESASRSRARDRGKRDTRREIYFDPTIARRVGVSPRFARRSFVRRVRRDCCSYYYYCRHYYLVNTDKGCNTAGKCIDYTNETRGVAWIMAKNCFVISALYKISAAGASPSLLLSSPLPLRKARATPASVRQRYA